MSPIFGKHHHADTGLEGDAAAPDSGHLPRLIELGAALDDAVREAAPGHGDAAREVAPADGGPASEAAPADGGRARPVRGGGPAD